MTKPAVWKNGLRFWTLERFALVFTVLMSPLGFMFYFVGGLITVPWAICMWLRAWRNPTYGYRRDGSMKTGLLVEIWMDTEKR